MKSHAEAIKLQESGLGFLRLSVTRISGEVSGADILEDWEPHYLNSWAGHSRASSAIGGHYDDPRGKESRVRSYLGATCRCLLSFWGVPSQEGESQSPDEEVIRG